VLVICKIIGEKKLRTFKFIPKNAVFETFTPLLPGDKEAVIGATTAEKVNTSTHKKCNHIWKKTYLISIHEYNIFILRYSYI